MIPALKPAQPPLLIVAASFFVVGARVESPGLPACYPLASLVAIGTAVRVAG